MHKNIQCIRVRTVTRKMFSEKSGCSWTLFILKMSLQNKSSIRTGHRKPVRPKTNCRTSFGRDATGPSRMTSNDQPPPPLQTRLGPELRGFRVAKDQTERSFHSRTKTRKIRAITAPTRSATAEVPRPAQTGPRTARSAMRHRPPRAASVSHIEP